MWKRQEGSFNQEFTYFYGVDGQLLGTYGGGYGGLGFGTGSTNVWFGGKLIWAEGKSAVTDRLGSVVNFGKKYYPYGEEPATTQQNHTKFATYYRDETTALDYAVNRYYGRTIGRFLTPDPYQASGGPADPQSWNRYSYVIGDPVNYIDPRGTNYAFTEPVVGQPSGFGQSWLTVGGYTTIPEYGTYIDLTYVSSWSPGGGGGGGAAANPRPECDMRDETNVKVISFLRVHQTEAQELEKSTGLNADFILAFAAYESGYGRSRKATVNNNFFGLTGSNPEKNGWVGAIECAGKASPGFACFDPPSLLESGNAAFFSQNQRYLRPALAAQEAGADVAGIANAIANAGFNSEYASGIYGNNVKGAADAIARRKDCP